jgi:AsmA family.
MQSVAAKQPPFYRRKPSRRALAISAVLLASLVVLIALFDWNWFKGPLESAVQARTGRTFHIAGILTWTSAGPRRSRQMH